MGDELQTVVQSLQVSLELQQRENQALREEIFSLKQKLASNTFLTLPSPSNSRTRLNEIRDSMKFTKSRQSSPCNSLPGSPRLSTIPNLSPSVRPSPQSARGGLINRLRLDIPAKENAFFPSSQPSTPKTSFPCQVSTIPKIFRASDESKLVDRLMERRGYLRKFEKIGPGSYRFGSRRVFVTVRNDRLLVRHGNAFVHIDQFANNL